MQFTPKTEEELKRESLLPPGLYDFDVMEAEEKVSKQGNDMIALKLKVFSDTGERHVRDWLMPSMGFKLRHFAETTGLVGAYEAGTLKAEDCKGRSGKVFLVIKDSEQYGPQNSVKDYEKAKKGLEPALTEPPKATAPSPAAIAAANDGIPFINDRLTWG